MRNIQCLRKVCQSNVATCIFDVNIISMKFCYWAVEEQILDANESDFMVQELSQQWSNVSTFIQSTSLRQGLQILKRYFSIILAFWLGISSSIAWFVMFLFQPQGIDSYITGNTYFWSSLEFFQYFWVYEANRFDQGFFLFKQLLSFFYGLLWRKFPKSTLPAEKGWDSIHCFVFTGCSFLPITEFKEQSHFRTAALRVVENSIAVDKQKLKRKTSPQVVSASVAK